MAMSMYDTEVVAYELAGGEFNMASPKQIQAILYDKMNLPILRKTPILNVRFCY